LSRKVEQNKPSFTSRLLYLNPWDI